MKSFWEAVAVAAIVAAYMLIAQLSGCTHNRPVHERTELVNWILAPEPGAKGLVSRRCAKSKGDACLEWDVVDFDLTVEADRHRLNDAEFECRVGDGAHFHICRQLHGLCQQTYVKSGSWFNRKSELKLISFLHIKNNYQYLIDKGTYCLSSDNPLAKDLDF